MKLSERLKRARAAFSENTESKSWSQTHQQWIQLAGFLGLDPEKDSGPEATYFQCLRVLGESMGKLPCKLMKSVGTGGAAPYPKSPMYYKIAQHPNPYMGATLFWSTIERNRNHWGNAYVWIDGYGNSMNLWPLKSECMEVWVDDAKLLSEVDDVYYIYTDKGKRRVFSSEEILHFRSSNTFDGIKGISVIDTLTSTIDGAKKSQRVVNDLYDNGMASKLAVQYTGGLNEDLAEKFARGIERYLQNDREEIRHVIPVPPGSTIVPIDMKLTDSQFMEIRKHTSLEIAGAFGIKPTQINDYSKASYSSQEQQQLAFYVDTLLYILKSYEDEMTAKLLSPAQVAGGMFFKFNASAILRADQKTQMDTLTQGVSSFVYTPNEARSFLDLPSVPGGDKLIGNGTSIPISMVGAQYTDGDEDSGGGENNAD